MPGPLAQAGATAEPSEYTALAMDEHFTGLWTQRSLLRDADVPYLYRKFYSASRFDSMLDGINREISARLTDVRRAGSSVFNTQSFPPGYSFYPYKFVQNNQEIIRVLYDGKDGTVYDATPNQKSSLFTKSAPTAHARFVTIGSMLYWADGGKTGMYVGSPLGWQATTSYPTGQYIIDPYGNIQRSLGAQIANITNIQVVFTPGTGPVKHTVTLFFSPTTPLNLLNNAILTLAGLTTVPSENKSTTPIFVQSSININYTEAVLGGNPPITPYSPETGTATAGTGISGSAPPTWSTVFGAVTQDGGNQWVNMGSANQPWGGAGPANAPTVTQVTAPSIYPAYAPDTWYAPSFVIFDGTNFQQLTTAGVTGSAPPAWATSTGTTPDGTCVWKFKGSGAWVAGATYAVGDLIVATYTYYFTVQVYDPTLHQVVTVQHSVSITSMFQCSTAGTSLNPGPPNWTNGINTVTTDGTVVWTNIGTPPAWPGATQTLSLATRVLDSTGNIETVQSMGKSDPSASPPAWQTAQGALTQDGVNATPPAPFNWLNGGPYSAANSAPWLYAYSGLNSITGDITDPSPISQPLILSKNMQPVVQGLGMPNPPYDQIILWRTAAGGSTLLYDDQFPNPGPSQPWIFTDTNSDKQLNVQMAAPGSISTTGLATPPPSTATAPEYHCGRIFMINGSYVIYSGGPDTVVGNSNSSFPPLNYFQFPEQPIRLKSVTMSNGGLLVYCVANTYVILGEGTANNPFLQPKMFMEGVGLLSYDCLCMRGSTLYGFSNRSKVFSFDPGNGEVEVGFPVADQFRKVTTGGINAALYSPATAYVTWHEADSSDTGLYVSDGAVGWFRWSAIAPPESGSLWSPRGAILNGTSAIQSIETTPGIPQLLIAPSATGLIRYRDNLVRGDWDSASSTYKPYPAWDVKGCISLCETGEVGEVVHIAIKSVAVGSRPIVSLLFDELQPGITVEGRTTAWDVLSLDDGHHEDPPNIEPSITMFSDRYRTSSTAEMPKCENFQLKVDYGTQLAADELLKFAIYGGTFKERRQQ